MARRRAIIVCLLIPYLLLTASVQLASQAWQGAAAGPESIPGFAASRQGSSPLVADAAPKSPNGLNTSSKIAFLSRSDLWGCIEKGSAVLYSFDDRVPQEPIGRVITIRAPPSHAQI